MTPIKPLNAPLDADQGNWVDRYAPAPAKPYLRLMRADRLIGVWLLLLPCWFGLALAAAEGSSLANSAPGAPFLFYALLFAIGAFVMRGAGCAYNDIIDRDFDGMVERTSLRPIPSGQITVKQAWIFLVVLAVIGLTVLLQLNHFTIVLGISSLALVAAYPFMKRITWWPQVWLGLTFNWGALVGYTSITGKLSVSVLLLYTASLLWTVGYDTIYAHQDKEDDALIGVKSSARALEQKTPLVLGFLYAGVIALFAIIGVVSHFSTIYFAALILPSAHLIWQVKSLKIDDAAHCLKVFKSNREAGFALLAPLLLEWALKAS